MSEQKLDDSGSAKKDNNEYKVGDKIIVKGRPGKRAQIVYIGEPKGWGGTYYGVRLTEKRGDCDGEWKGQRFFKCEKNFGQYIRRNLIEGLLDEDEGKDFDFLNETETLEKLKEEENKKYKEARDKYAKLKKAFVETDKDGNLALDVKEFTKLAVKALHTTEDEAEKLFKSIDVSGNGDVSFAEFDAWLGNGGITKIEQYGKLTDAFKNADKDGNLTLELSEFVKMAKDSMDLDEKDAQELFDQIDTNKNGDICFDEFEAYVNEIGGMDNLKNFSDLKQYFKEADVDGSNGLDLKEFIKLSKEKLGIATFRAKKMFDKVDTDKSGTIQFNEFEAYIDKIGGVRRLKEKDELEAKKKEIEEQVKAENEAKQEAKENNDQPADDSELPKQVDDAPADDAEPPKEDAPKEEPPKEEPAKPEAKEEAKEEPKKEKKAVAKKDEKKDAKKDVKKDAKKDAKKDVKKDAKKDAGKKATPAKKDAKKDVKKSPAKGAAAKKDAKKDAKKPAAKGAAAKKPAAKGAAAKKDAKKPAAKGAAAKKDAKKDAKKGTGKKDAKKDAKKPAAKKPAAKKDGAKGKKK